MDQNKNTNHPIRVLQVLTIMNRGGAETMIMNYYRSFDKSKVQFDFLLHRTEKGAFDDEIKALGGNIYYMPSISPLNYFRYQKKLRTFFKEHRDYKIIHSHLNALSSIVLKIAKEAGIPTRIAHSHIAIEPYVAAKLFSKNTDRLATIKDTIQSLVRYKVRHYATHFFACSQKAGEWLFGKKHSKNIVVINNAINTSQFIYNQNIANKAKTKLKLSGKKVIGHVGRFNEQKNHFLLIKIFNELVKKDPDFHLVLIGDGNLKQAIEKEVHSLNIHNNVQFLGLQEDIPFFLQAFDLFLFPSLYEGLPVTLIEAQAAGLKIITSSTVTKEVDITDLVFFCDLKESPEHWAELVIDHITYDRRNTKMAIVDSKFDIEENAKNLQNFYIKHQ